MPKNFLTLWFFGTWTLSLKILLHLASCNHYLPYHQNHYFLLCIIQRFALTVTRQILTSFWSSVDDQSKSIIYIRLFRVHVQSSSPSVNISNYNFFPTYVQNIWFWKTWDDFKQSYYNLTPHFSEIWKNLKCHFFILIIFF